MSFDIKDQVGTSEVEFASNCWTNFTSHYDFVKYIADVILNIYRKMSLILPMLMS
jgi:hypothetical protein